MENKQTNNRDMEQKVINILAFNDLGFDVDKLELTYNNELITDVEVNMEGTNLLEEGVVVFHTEWGDAGTFDMLENWQQQKIYEYLDKVA